MTIWHERARSSSSHALRHSFKTRQPCQYHASHTLSPTKLFYNLPPLQRTRSTHCSPNCRSPPTLRQQRLPRLPPTLHPTILLTVKPILAIPHPLSASHPKPHSCALVQAKGTALLPQHYGTRISIRITVLGGRWFGIRGPGRGPCRDVVGGGTLMA